MDLTRRIASALVALGWIVGQNTARAEAPADLKPFTQQIPETDLTFDMLPVPGGTVTLGSPDGEEDRQKSEGPQVKVELQPFYMSRYELTQAEFDAFRNQYNTVAGKGGAATSVPDDKLADAVTYPTPMFELEAGPIFQRMGRGGRYPAVIMSQYAARQYTKWVSKRTGRFYRLPTEAEWEYACRAGTTTPYGFAEGEKLGDYAWFFDNSELPDGDAAYHEVGKKKPNAWGFYDMHGNVAELVIDQFAADAYAKLAEKPQPVKAADAVNWPTKQYPKLARGGGYESEAEECRSASRNELKAGVNGNDPQLPRSPHWYSDGFWVGMRLVSPAVEPSKEEQQKYWDSPDPQTVKILQDRGDRQVREVVEAPKNVAK